MALAKSRVIEILNAVQSRGLRTGHFAGVFGAEPMGAAGVSDLTMAVWIEKIKAVPGRGLAGTGVRLEIFIRIYSAALSDYRDDIDPSMMSAAADLLGLFIGGFTLDGFAAFVDVKGQYGDTIGADSGHLTLDRKIFRVYDIIVPLIVDDLWSEAP